MEKWEKVKIKDLCINLGKGKHPAAFADKNGHYPFIVSGISVKSCSDFDSSDEVFCIGDGGCANIHYVNGRYAASDHTYIFKSKNQQVLTKYIYEYLKGNIYILEKGFKGAGIKNITKSYIENIEIPVPPLEIQNKIIKELDTINALLDKQNKLLSEHDELIKSIFYDMFGDPILNNKNLELVKLSDLGNLARGKSKHRPRNAPELLGGKYPLIQTGDIAQSGLYLKEYNQTYSELGLKQSKMWTKGTLCITIAANIAKTSILTFDACFPDSVVGFQPNKKCNIMYIQIWLSFLQKMLEDTAPQAAQKNINLNTLENLLCPLPSIEKQNLFAKYVEKIDMLCDKIKSEYIDTSNLLKSITAEYFNNQ